MKTAILLLFASLCQPFPAASADDSSWQLQGGGTVTVDPDTRRATVTRDGVTTPLYNGTHRTEEGNVLIIRQGITTIPGAVPPALPRQPEDAAEQWEGAMIAGYSPCEKLVLRVCGKQDQCADSEGCRLARQLLEMESGERNESEDRNRMTFTSGQCIEARPDTELFPFCAQ